VQVLSYFGNTFHISLIIEIISINCRKLRDNLQKVDRYNLMKNITLPADPENEDIAQVKDNLNELKSQRGKLPLP
jgi:hypothetical protein